MLNYKDFIGKGSYHIVSYIDNDWVLKSPLSPEESADSSNNILQFNNHINFMKKYPNIFQKVKKIDKCNAAIENLNTIQAKNEINYIYKLCRRNNTNGVPDFIANHDNSEISSFRIYTVNSFFKELYKNDSILKLFETYIEYDNIAKKWYNFILLLKITFKGISIKTFIYNKDIPFSKKQQREEYENDKFYLDLHDENVGIDIKGNLKLIDF